MSEITNNKFDFYYGKEAEQFIFTEFPNCYLQAAEIVIEEREKNDNIHLVCASPFSGFENRWSEHEQALYRSITE